MSTTTVPVVEKTTTIKRFVSGLTRSQIFWGSFGVALFFNFLAALGIFSGIAYGVQKGYEGEASFGWGMFISSAGSLFGGLGSLVLTLVVLAAIAIILWLVLRLSKRGHEALAIVLAVLIGWLVLDRLLDNVALTFGFIPFLVLIVVTALEALATLTVLTALSRKRDDTH